MPKTQERFSAMRSNMRALLPLSPPVLGSLYGARARSKAEASTHSRRNAGARTAAGILEHGVEFKINGKNSHHFAQLFLELKEPTKQELSERFKTAILNMDPNEIPQLERILGIVVPKDLKTNLVEWADVFTELRYAHSFVKKYKGKNKTMMFYPQIRDSVYSIIIDREPTWTSAFGAQPRSL